MKSNYILPFIFLFIVNTLIAQDWKQIVYSNSNETFEEICNKIEEQFKYETELQSGEIYNREKEGSSYNKYQQWKYFMQFRLTEDGKLPDAKTILEGFANEKAKQKVAKSANCDWTFIDQTENDGGYWGIGRTTCVTFHPSNDQLFYVCTPGGGIWKTSDGGQNYTSSDDGLPYGATSNLLIDPINPNILYVSNGDHIGWWTNSTGVYKSTDGGATWLPTSLTFTMNNTAIYELKMNPENPAILLAATTNGLYQTLDGGLNWTKIRNNAHSSVCFKPGNGSVIYTATDDYWGSSEVYKSEDAGMTWTPVTDLNYNHNFIRLAVTPLDADRLLVSCSYDGFRPLFETLDAGTSFNQLADTPENDIIAYSPIDVNTLYCGYVVAYRSTNGGSSWNQITDWWNSGSYDEIHADFHYVGYSNNSSHIYFCNDGGVYRLNESNNTWTDLSNGLKIGQFYRIANATDDAIFMIGGTQDNGGRKRLSNGNWVNENGGDGMEVAIEPGNMNTYYTTYINGTYLERTTNGGASKVDIHANIPESTYGQWVTPYDLDPNNSSTIIAAYDNIFKSTNKGNSWIKIGSNTIDPGQGFTDLEIAPSNSDIIYAVYEDYLFKTIDGGDNWTTVNLPGTTPVTRITIHPENPDRLWISRGGYVNNYKVYYSVNGGTSWTNWSTGLPNVPSNVIIYEPNSPGRLYVGNDYGVYYRDSVMTAWEVYGQNLPITFVNDLEIVQGADKLRAGTFGRGIWEIDLCATTTAEINEEYITDDFALVYPNPAENKISIVQKTIHSIENITMTDLNGKEVPLALVEKNNIVEISFDTPAGIYFLKYTVNGQVYGNKIVIK